MAGKRAHAAAAPQCTPAAAVATPNLVARRFATRTRSTRRLFDAGEIAAAARASGIKKKPQQQKARNGKTAEEWRSIRVSEPELSLPPTLKSEIAGGASNGKQQWSNQSSDSWRNLGVSASELSLPLTFVTGQNFRWRPTGPSQYTGVVGLHLVSLRECGAEDGVAFLLHTADAAGAAEAELRDYLNLDTSLEKLYEDFVVADVRFAAVAPYLTGARLLRQNPLECLFQFICSSNNHIQRISGMVEYLATRGPRLGTVQGLDFHAFPSVAELSELTEEQLRKAGFGYRAKFIVGATEALRSKDGGGEQWLMSLRSLSLEEAVKALCSLPGVGPKVAACIALFSLDQHHAIPVDTHVWQMTVRYFLPELAGKSLTLRLHQEVQDVFVNRFGKYAGWAHQVLFIAELSSQQALLPEHLRLPKQNVDRVKRKVKKSILVDGDEAAMSREHLSSLDSSNIPERNSQRRKKAK